ncbi:RNA polymerase beta subunit [Vibrio phage C-ZP2022]|nr:RNA polymerase beta subunit [Vibrio phage C-ZP2022]
MLVEKLHTNSLAIGITEAITSFERFNSGSRTAMTASQSSQAVVFANGPDSPRILTTFENEQAIYSMGTTMPVDGLSKGLINKFSTGYGMNAIRVNPSRTMLFVDQDTNELDCLDVKTFDYTHDIFGYELKENPLIRHTARENVAIPKGTKLTSSSSVMDNGLYSTILQANYCYLSASPTIEDGVWASESFVRRAMPYAFAKITFEWGRTHYPLDAYGDGSIYKPFCGPGEKIKPSGLVAATRAKCPIFDGILMLPSELKKVQVFDKAVYAPPESEDVEVADITVTTTTRDHSRLPLTPIGMEAYPRIFAEQHSKFYDRLLDVYSDYMRTTNYKGRISPRLSNLLTRAYADKPNDSRARFGARKAGGITRTQRGTPIDEWHVELKLKWKFRIGDGGKVTNLHGSKGVFSRIVPDEDMPTDQYGRRAEIVMYGGSTIARLNDGQLYEQYVNACGDTVAMKAKQMLDAGDLEGAWSFLMGWYEIASPETFAVMSNKSPAKRADHINLIAESGPTLIIPGDNTYVGVDWIKRLNVYCPPIKTPVTFRNLDGNMVTTEVPVLIGSASWWILDKSSTKPMAVSVARRQIHGLPSTLNKSTKISSPTNKQPSRAYAESEIRGITAAVHGKYVMDVVDLSVNPEALDMMLRAQWKSDTPMGEYNMVDRSQVGYGEGRSVSIPRHILECLGPTITRSA